MFAFSVDEVPRISKEVITHKLNIDPDHRHIKQKKRNFAPERQKVIVEEVDKLLKARVIREVQYPTWLSNVVIVPKPNGGGR